MSATDTSHRSDVRFPARSAELYRFVFVKFHEQPFEAQQAAPPSLRDNLLLDLHRRDKDANMAFLAVTARINLYARGPMIVTSKPCLYRTYGLGSVRLNVSRITSYCLWCAAVRF